MPSCSRSRPARSWPPPSRAARRRSTRTTACSPSARASTRPCSGSSRMERSCQAQLMAMAAGEPKQITARVRLVHRGADRFPAGRLVQLPAALAGDLPHRPRALRLTACRPRRPARRGPSPGSSTPPRPRRCSSCRPSPSTSARRSPSCCSTRSSRQTVAWLRMIGAAIAVLAVSRGSMAGLDAPGARRRRPCSGSPRRR